MPVTYEYPIAIRNGEGRTVRVELNVDDAADYLRTNGYALHVYQPGDRNETYAGHAPLSFWINPEEKGAYAFASIDRRW